MKFVKYSRRGATRGAVRAHKRNGQNLQDLRAHIVSTARGAIVLASNPGLWRGLAKRPLSRGALWLHLILAAIAVGIIAAPRTSSFASDGSAVYRLSAQDKVRVTIYEWRPAKDELFEWKGVNAEYTVQPNGNVSVPLIGEVRAAGLSTGELAQSIGSMLKDRTGLVQVPDVSVEIVLFRPIYITGQVERPGEFAYRPGLTVLQGVTLSGGIRRSPVGARVERDIITGRSDLKHQAADYSALLARKARFEAELADEEEVRFPAELTERADDQAIATLMQRERTLFETRRSAIQNQIRVLKDLHQYLESEVTSVQGQLVTHNRQIELVKKELDAVNTLVSKGLAVEPRRLGLERNVAQLEGDRLRLESSMSRARQEMSKTGMTSLELSTKRQIDAATGLSETQAKLEEVTRRFETSKGLLHEAEAMAPMVMGDMRTGRVQPVYTIVRLSVGGIATEIIAAETTPVQPGDTIKVDVPVEERPLDRAPDPGRFGKQPS